MRERERERDSSGHAHGWDGSSAVAEGCREVIRGGVWFCHYNKPINVILALLNPAVVLRASVCFLAGCCSMREGQ